MLNSEIVGFQSKSLFFKNFSVKEYITFYSFIFFLKKDSHWIHIEYHTIIVKYDIWYLYWITLICDINVLWYKYLMTNEKSYDTNENIQ